MKENESLEEKVNNNEEIKINTSYDNSNDHKSVKKKSTKKNYFYNLIYQLFLVIVPLVVTPYISRVLTVDGVGKYSFSFSIITYFTIFGALGFGYYAQREIAKNQGNNYLQSKSFWEINICRLIPVSVALITNLVLCMFKTYGDYNNLMLIFSINIAALAFDIAFFFQGNEEFGKIVLRNVIIKSLSIAAIFIFVKKESDLWVYALINSIMLILSNVSLWPYMTKYLVKINIKELKPLKHLKGTLILFIPTIAVSIYTVLDKTLIGLLVPGTYTEIEEGKEIIKKYSDLENGYYEQSEKLVKMVMVVITCIGTVMIPRNSNEIANGNFEKVKQNIVFSSKLVILIGLPLCLGIIIISSNLVPWFLGPGFDKSIILLKVLAPLILIIGLSNVFGLQYLVPSKHDIQFTIALCIGAISNLILNVIFIPLWWSLGAAIGTIIAELIVTSVMAIMVRKEVNIIKVIISSWKVLIASGIMFISCFYFSKLFTPSIINTIIIVSFGVLIYFLILLILKEKLVYYFLNLLKCIISKKNKKQNE